MTVEKIARSVQFTLDQHGKTTAVVLTPELWVRSWKPWRTPRTARLSTHCGSGSPQAPPPLSPCAGRMS